MFGCIGCVGVSTNGAMEICVASDEKEEASCIKIRSKGKRLLREYGVTDAHMSSYQYTA